MPRCREPAARATPAATARASAGRAAAPARLEEARLEAGKREPLFLRARVDEVTHDNDLDEVYVGVSLRLDEAAVGASHPMYFEALIVPRATQWSDPGNTQRTWRTTSFEPSSSSYRQTARLEGSITVDRLSDRIPTAELRALIERVFRPAVDDCLRLGEL